MNAVRQRDVVVLGSGLDRSRTCPERRSDGLDRSAAFRERSDPRRGHIRPPEPAPPGGGNVGFSRAVGQPAIDLPDALPGFPSKERRNALVGLFLTEGDEPVGCALAEAVVEPYSPPGLCLRLRSRTSWFDLPRCSAVACRLGDDGSRGCGMRDGASPPWYWLAFTLIPQTQPESQGGKGVHWQPSP